MIDDEIINRESKNDKNTQSYIYHITMTLNVVSFIIKCAVYIVVKYNIKYGRGTAPIAERVVQYITVEPKIPTPNKNNLTGISEETESPPTIL